MKDFRLDGVEVCTSFLTQRSYHAACCELLLKVTPKNKKKALATFRQAGELGAYSGLRLSGIEDMSFLQDFPLLLYLEVVDQKRVNTRQLDCLENLRGLNLNSPGAGVDFSCFPYLEVFVGDWHVDNLNIELCDQLRQLRIWQYKPRSQDMSVLANMMRLDLLNITQTNITSLSGIETLDDLRYFDIAYAPKLTDLKALATNPLGIRELDMQNAKKISSYKPLVSLSRLRDLRISACSPMPNLKWTRGMDYLNFFSFVDTNVADGDLSHLLKLPKLRYIGTLDKRHYNYTHDELNYILQQRSDKA